MRVLIFVLFFLVLAFGANIPPKSCPLEKDCAKVDEESAICGLDEDMGCIRKYASRCHLDIAACNQGKEFKDFSDLYCSMEAYFCEKSPTYERWTIFFGHEDD
ncbi:uncharacterized protein [Drosophila kikkawai]|uniref:Uncharacterized protein isoform X2 n=1 Tax=Drosophila kikkawai TaxID=30033 RepID=A0A6P4HPU9_DROKI|nr:uncharacterized protein LOC108071610 isoform X2 [Drosophila kikkawai]